MGNSLCEATGGTVCRFYGSSTGCWYGDQCRFIHELSTNSHMAPPRRRQQPRCRYYRTRAGCRYGTRCEFRHDDELTIQQMQGGVDEKSLVSGFEDLSLATSKIKIKSEITDDAVAGRLDESGDHQYYTAEEDEGDYDEEDYGSGTGAEEDDENRWNAWKSDKMEKDKPDIQEAVCGECDTEFEGDDAFDQLKDHYMDKLLSFNYQHLKFLSKHHRFNSPTTCIICDDKMFMRSRDLLRHMTDKIKNEKDDSADHHLLLEVGVALPFCYRDTVDHDDDKLNTDLFLALVNTYTGLDSDDSDTDDLVDFMKYMTVMQKNPGLQKMWQENDDDSDDYNFGFTADEVEELAMQGIRPWDAEAHDALDVLYDHDY